MPLAAALLAALAPAADPLDAPFRERVLPFLQSYCLSCHGPDKPKGDLDLSPFTGPDAVAKDYRRWELVLDRLRAGDMPPESAKRQPGGEERRAVIDWVVAARKAEADRTAGDPGPVLPRRLSAAEYDNSVRDLTGADIRPAREFPVDPANEAGFDNSGESLAMSPALFGKYLEAARRVADHLVLTPDGLRFAPHPAVAETDRDKFAVNRIVDFYKRQRTDLADFFFEAWRRQHGRPADTGLSERYLARVNDLLTGPREAVGPVAALQLLWNDLPADEAGARRGCERMRDFVADLRAKLVPPVANLTAPKVHNGSQPLVLWKNRQFAANRTRYAGGALELTGVKLPPGSPAARAMEPPAWKGAAMEYEATFPRFCATFPDAFAVTERARVYLDPSKEKALTGRLLSAGFHSQMGYFRDDGPLYDLILDDAGRRQLDRLWEELDFVTNAPVRQYQGFLWFDRTDAGTLRPPQFDPFRPEDKACTDAAKVRRLAELFAEQTANAGASEKALGAIRDYFAGMEATFRRLEAQRAAAEPKHLDALLTFAQRAYRRPLTADERAGLLAFYRELRQTDGLSHEDALRDAVARVLASPHFAYRVDRPAPGASGGTVALDDYSLASRLSYFLWASLPDERLLGLAASGELRRPEVLAAEARRMLADPRARALATEFALNWLDARRFEEHNAVDRQRFPAFDNDLRRAMFEEPVRFLQDLAARDGSILEMLGADHTFVNAALARHYGMPEPAGGGWVRVDGARKYGRGGLPPMAVFLTKNAPGLRTSPVKRGYWVARRLLGEHIPPPPPGVPDLPDDEAKLGTLTLRDALARHRADRACAGCHERFDSLGLAFEGYGPVGERRERDLGGRPVDSRAEFPGGTSGDGLAGLTDYLTMKRRGEFVETFARKLLAYGLGRAPLPSDEKLVAETRSKLEAGGFRFGVAVEAVVTSPQFRTRRGP